MKKIFVLLSFIFLLNGCVESIAMLGSGASNGKMLQSSLNSAISYGVKKQTGKTPLGHALAYAEEKNPEKKKEPCVAFIKKTNSEICAVVKKQITLTKAKLKKKELADNSSQKIASSLQPVIDKKSKIKYLDR